MRLSRVPLTLAVAGSLVSASAQPHGHQYHHKHRIVRSPGDAKAAVAPNSAHVKVVTIPGPTVVEFELDGKPISKSQACQGIKAGNLQWTGDTNHDPVCASEEIPATDGSPTSKLVQHNSYEEVSSDTTSYPHQGAGAHQQYSSPSPIGIPSSTSTAVSAASFTSLATPDAAPAPISEAENKLSSSSSKDFSGSSLQGGQGLDREFADGQIDCWDFPSDYGPVEVPWIELGGWSGIQYPTIQGQVVVDVVTGVAGGRNCSAGALCSYACPPGYQKSQWPPVQGANGQSVGGLRCNSNNKLQLTNPGLSKNLCIKGTGATKVQNKMGANVAICRTDYPGTEDETVPLNTQPKTINELTCPDSSTYFKHDGSPTTAQYYVNKKGVPLPDACSWNKDGSSKGNWAPTYFGVGQDLSGKTFLSIASTKQNNPVKYSPLDFVAEITGGGLSGKCRVKDGQYCSGETYNECNGSGCTVSS